MCLKNGLMKTGISRKKSALVIIKRMLREGSKKEEETAKQKKRSLQSRITTYTFCVDIGYNLFLNSGYYTQN